MKTLNALLKINTLPRIELRALLSFVLKQPHSYLISHGEEVLSDDRYKAFETLVRAREQGTPLAYLIGEREFYGRLFHVSNAVLIPRFDSETLIEQALANLAHTPQPKILDLGTGSGILAITLACERPDAMITATDISQEALEIAKRNNARHHTQIQFFDGNWFDALPPNYGHFDLIISNPPYIAGNDHHLQEGDLRFEPRHALTDNADGLTHYRTIIDNSRRYLADNGKLLFEHGFDQSLAIQLLLEKAEFAHIYTSDDLNQQPRVTGGVYLTTP